MGGQKDSLRSHRDLAHFTVARLGPSERFTGLDFDGTGDGALQLRFRLVDAAEPQREFFACVVVAHDDRYELRSSYPSLPKASLARVKKIRENTRPGSMIRIRRLRRARS